MPRVYGAQACSVPPTFMISKTPSESSPFQRVQGSGQEPSNLQFSLKKILPIKKNDAEMLTRQDIQFDLLDTIFNNTVKAFTDQRPGHSSKKLCFSELYISALYQSSKCSKVLKDKMRETPAFATELGKISLLANVGRINTTMAFFPEMRTALRTYHPVPSLQKTDGNLQDAPRIKNCLKASLLPSERDLPPTSLAAVLEKLRTGIRPPTAIVNLIFIMANQTTLLARTHFDPPLDFLDLFMPINIPSQNRARAFLWLVYHYLEDPTSSKADAPSTNPFADEYSRKNPGKVPWLPRLSTEDMQSRGENLDPKEEIEWGNKMCALRTTFLQRLVKTSEVEKKNRSEFTSSEVLELVPTIRKQRAHRQTYLSEDQESGFRHYAPQASPGCESVPSTSQLSPSLPHGSVNDSIKRPQLRTRRMLDHAFRMVATADPLASSDEEFDEDIREDYDQRLYVLKRLRGKSPTPPSHLMHMPEEHRYLSRARWHPYARIKRRCYKSNGQFYDVTD